jgi:hypothetical protein
MKEAEVRLGIGQQTITDGTLAKLQAKAEDDMLYCEFGAPRFVRDVPAQEKADRYRAILGDRVCAKITSIRRGDDGHIYGTVVPFGPHAQPVQRRIESGQPDQLLFGARIVTKASVAEVITYDLVKF